MIKFKIELSPSKKIYFICFYESRLKMTKNHFCFILKVFCQVEKTSNFKKKVNFKIYDTYCQFWSVKRIELGKYFSPKLMQKMRQYISMTFQENVFHVIFY